MKILKILSEKKFKSGYVVRKELIGGKEFGSKDLIMSSAYNLEGKYIGNTKTAFRLCQIRGIKPEISHKDNNVCSIGFSDKDNKWYGWSHRAIFGFGIGYKITNKVCGFSRIKKPFIIKTLKEAKKVAIKFADNIS